MLGKLTIYSSINDKLIDYFQGVVDPLQVSFFVCTNTLLNFDCIFSSIDEEHIGKKSTLYDLSALMRVLCLEEGVVKDSISEDVFPKASLSICRILEWNDYIKRVVIFDLKGVLGFNEKQFINRTEGDSEFIDEVFLKCFQNFSVQGEK